MNFNSNYQDIRRSLVGPDSLDGKVTANSFYNAVAYDEFMYDAEIEATDVLCGRGKTSFNHVGNRRFRDLIAANTDKYNNAKSRLEKSMVVHSIVEEVKKVKGRFLKQDRYSGRWFELDERQAKEKVGHAIRDASSTSSVDPKKKMVKRTKSQESSTSSSLAGNDSMLKDPPTRATVRRNNVSNSTNKQFGSEDCMMMDMSSSMSEDMSCSSGRIRMRLDESYPKKSSSNSNSSSNNHNHNHSKSIMNDACGWDDFEPLHVDSLEAQNSLSVLQNDDFFLQQMDAVLGPASSTTAAASPAAVTPTGTGAKGPTHRYQQPFRIEMV